MSKELVVIRSLTTYACCAAVALLLGYLLARPDSLLCLLVVSLVLAMLLLPVYLKWSHAVLVFSWCSTFVVFFLPGFPPLWTVLAVGGLLVARLRYIMSKRSSFVEAPGVSYPLILLFVLVLLTALLTGGIGGRALGSELWGAKRYLSVFGAIIGFFALCSERIPIERARLYASLFFLSGVTWIFGDLIFAGGPRFYFLFSSVSSDAANLQAQSQFTLGRFSGAAWSSMAIIYFLLLRYGIRGVLDLRSPWRLALFLAVLVLGMFGGFRSSVILLALVVAFQFYFERLVRTKYAFVLAGILCLSGVFLVGFLHRMPLSVQRCFSFLPIEINPVARLDAASTLDWRLEMWKVVFPQVPKHLLKPKGYAYDSTDYLLTQEGINRGMFPAYEGTLVSGNYHNGILTLLIPFGIFGGILFAWFCFSALRVLHANYRYGAPELLNINTFLLACFYSRLLFYLAFYGQFDLDLYIFTGILGLGLSLNGNVAGRERRAEQPVRAGSIAVAQALPVG